ncbi:MAG: hypothetical protein NC355_09785 [Blautia sp.]|nr:hypothetical protein [Blautia sp.]
MTVDEMICSMYTDMQGIREDVGELKSEVKGLREDVDVLKADVDALKQQVGDLQLDVDELKLKEERTARQLVALQMMQENEIRPNICIVAENHIELQKKLKAATKSKEEYDMVDIRLSILESDIRNIKAAMAPAS